MEKPVPKPTSKQSSKTSWESVAAWYDELLSGDDTYQSKVILPNLLRLVAPAEQKNGVQKKIIDIACGQGFFSHAFAAEGAEVFGLDISPELIAIARKNSTQLNPRFEVAPVENLKPAASDSFDVATIVLALQNIKEMNAALKETARVLKTGGELVLVLNHPCFRIPKGSAWGFDEAAKVQYRRVDKYGRPFTVDIDMAPGAKKVSKENAVQTVSFHRPLQDYFKALSGAGLVVTGLEEWISHKKSEAGPWANAEDAARKEFPMFMTIVARKA